MIVADEGNQRVRLVAAATGTAFGQPVTAGSIYTIAGDGATGYSGDGGPATSARLIGPSAVAGCPGGEVAISDAMAVRAVARRLAPPWPGSPCGGGVTAVPPVPVCT